MAYSNQPNSYNPAVRNRRSSQYYGDKYDDIIWPETLRLMKRPEMKAIGLHHMGRSWVAALQQEFFKPYFRKIALSVYNQRIGNPRHVSPSPDKVFAWTRYCDIEDVRAVILAQDPYISRRLAEGLAFSVTDFQSIPWRYETSLAIISKAVAYSELGIPTDSTEFEFPNHGDLTSWAKQGVLLLNTFLTVGRGALSHRRFGWQYFTDAVIKAINDIDENVVFMLWGKEAKKKKRLIDQSRHLVLEAPHPSPRSDFINEFLTCDHFAIANQYLLDHGNGQEIDWCGAFWPDGYYSSVKF